MPTQRLQLQHNSSLSSHTGWQWEENTSRKRMKQLMNYILGFFILITSFEGFSCKTTVYWLYGTMESTKNKQGTLTVYINMKIQYWNFCFTEENYTKLRVPAAIRRTESEQESRPSNIPCQNLTDFRFHHLVFGKNYFITLLWH